MKPMKLPPQACLGSRFAGLGTYFSAIGIVAWGTTLSGLKDVKLDHAIRYVQKVIETRDPMVTIEV